MNFIFLGKVLIISTIIIYYYFQKRLRNNVGGGLFNKTLFVNVFDGIFNAVSCLIWKHRFLRFSGRSFTPPGARFVVTALPGFTSPMTTSDGTVAQSIQKVSVIEVLYLNHL